MAVLDSIAKQANRLASDVQMSLRRARVEGNIRGDDGRDLLEPPRPDVYREGRASFSPAPPRPSDRGSP